VSGAERGTEPTRLLLILEKLDHSSRSPDWLTQIFAIVDAGDPEHLEPVLLELAARRLEEPLEVGEVAIALREDQHVAAGLLDGLRHQVIGPLVVGRRVHQVDSQIEAALQRVEGLLLRNAPELTRSESHRAHTEVAAAQSAVLHRGWSGITECLQSVALDMRGKSAFHRRKP
jgi:hypothetical protein